METIGDYLFAFAVYGGIFLVVGGLIYLAIWLLRPKKEVVENWRQAEMALGLTYKQPRVGYPILEGQFANYSVKLQGSPASGGGNTRSTPAQTHYTAFHSNGKMPILRLEVDDDIFLRGDREVGDPDFDEKFQISFAKEAVARNVFSDPAVRQKIMALNYPVVYINKDQVTVSEKDVQGDPNIMRDRLQLAVALAQTVENLRP
ncbi:MAG: hypothetical protein H6652_04725 [Ardenticatenaceae bacterium]|nr:hypothetical protein [Ardenticatenaceae bacterium]MCB8946485.1 hypothetical protein [Ardenticatenaceae bacterium]